ncbi:ABC transporter ATP-binding protein [Anaeromyxobacter diazotrophicus]|uniref:ABC transporter ATP-binding protein n=1 Tax=Anaeromyxobacter diazotrophicus TaxID=2590199 RepID=A0A7I9VQ88_9BACT|nr:ABC transporter ATP-binding protein [Anaeromyxobacter diazotrophicus]GEJ58586.1 ABC transporter ATP-binding protein [Anaeromyxobacter diazotrophicus]
MLTLKNVEVVYDDVILVLKGLSLHVPQGKIVALLGSNGAGKSTTLKAISGLLAAEDGEVTDGAIELDGQRIEELPPEDVVRRGIFQVMEGRRVFEDLTVDENLVMGGYTRRDRAGLRRDHDLCFDYFPRLKERRKRLAGYLSGGEQQMVAIGRALMARPRLILLDEPSLGLAPLLVSEIFRIIARINAEEKTTFLVVEQNARIALAVAHHGYVMEGGRIVLEGDPDKLAANEDVKEFYLGGGAGGERRSFKNLKSYRRRKRWIS